MGARASGSVTLPAAVLLDLDDTLLDTRGAWIAVLGEVTRSARAELPGLDAAAFERRYLDARDDIYRRVLDGELDLTGYRAEHLSAALEPWGVPSSGLLEANDRLREEMAGRASLRDDAAELLDLLRGAGVRTALLTNGTSVVQRRKIDAVGLEGHIDAIGVSEELGASKPDPEAFLRALALIDARPDEAMMVGDNLDWDVRGALAGGLAGAVWLSSDGEEAPAGAVRVGSLAEVPSALERLSARST